MSTSDTEPLWWFYMEYRLRRLNGAVPCGKLIVLYQKSLHWAKFNVPCWMWKSKIWWTFSSQTRRPKYPDFIVRRKCIISGENRQHQYLQEETSPTWMYIGPNKKSIMSHVIVLHSPYNHASIYRRMIQWTNKWTNIDVRETQFKLLRGSRQFHHTKISNDDH